MKKLQWGMGLFRWMRWLALACLLAGATSSTLTQTITVGEAIPLNVLIEFGDVVQIGAGAGYTCAISTVGGVRCWGYNAGGQLGDGTTTDRSSATNVFGLLTGVAAISVGRGSNQVGHTCALTSAGAVKCWGANESGQLGDGTTTNRLTPVDVVGLGSGVVAIASGGQHTCAVMAGGDVKCWGNNLSGQLGDGTQVQRLTPVTVPGLTSSVVSISASFQHTCVLTSSGGTLCWGANESGEVGDGTTTNRSIPVSVSSLSSGVLSVSAGGIPNQTYIGYLQGGMHSCAVTISGGAKCWGSNRRGQLGNAALLISRLTPFDVTGLTSGVATISTGGSNEYFSWGHSYSIDAHTCAVTANGGAKCWGANDWGQLGDGTPLTSQSRSSSTPVNVSGLSSTVASIAAGGNHTCALTVGGGVKCWGGNGNGQLGDGTTTTRNVPVATLVTASGLTPQLIVFGASLPIAVGAMGNVTASGGGSGNPVAFTSLTQTICSITGTTVTGIAGGLCTIAANQLGNDYYEQAVQTSLNLRIGDPILQVITFGAVPSLVVGGLTSVSATASSGLPVTYSSNTPSICSISNNTVTGIALGTCTIAADQAGDGLYDRAPQTTQNIPVSAISSRLINISTRGQVQTGDSVMIGGFIIGGSTPKTVLITARGPSLTAHGVPGVLANPVLNLYSGQTVIFTNDNWGDAPNVSAIQTTGVAPSDALESAILTTLNPGPYTAIVSGASGSTGVGMVEVFEVDNANAPLINISTRGRVLTGDSVLIGGFIIQGNSPQTVLIRAVGPNLANHGVPNVLADPVLQLFSGQTVIASNDNWVDAANAAAIQATGTAPVYPLESAILITLNPGPYTAIMSGANGSTGVGIVEVVAQ